MTNYDVKFLAEIGNHPVLALAHLAADEIDRDFVQPFVVFRGEGTSYASTGSAALYIEHEGQIVSLLTFHVHDNHCYWIGTAWTHSDHRGRGMYRALYKRLYEIAQHDKAIDVIGCGVKGVNIASQKAHEALGMSIEFLSYVAKVDKTCVSSESSSATPSGSTGGADGTAIG